MDKKTQALVEQYSKSLVEVAVENDKVTQIQSEVASLLGIFETTELDNSLSSLAISHEEKVKLVRLLQESSSAYLNNFLEVILQNEREAYLLAILKSVQSGFVAATNQHDIYVRTAVALSDAQKNRILTLVAEKFAVKAGHLVETIDDSLIGGFVISVNNKVIDTSISSQLRQLKMNFK